MCRSPYQNPHNGKEKFASGTSTVNGNFCTPTPATTYVSTPADALVIAFVAASGSAYSSVVRYLEDNLQRILKTILDFRSLTPVPAPVITAALHYKGLCERPLKAWFPNIYWDKTHLECYNFFQQCKDHFAIAGATGPNRVLFAAIFLNNTALFCWQQYQHKINDQTNVSISCKGLIAFLCQSLGKSEAFVNTI